MQQIDGNILDVVATRGGILVHQVNCMGYAGAGLALQIRFKWPAWYQAYVNTNKVLGKVQLFDVSAWGETPIVTIANLFAQYNVGRHKQMTDEHALATCLDKLKQQVDDDDHLYFPYRMSCGNGGGDWPTVYKMIATRFPTATIVKLP